MRFAGIDIASETHVVAIVNAEGAVELKATAFTEDATGYQKLLALLGAANAVLIAMEATGHYWKNLFAVLAATGHTVALLNPLRTHRFAGVDLERTKTDTINAVGIARFAAQKRPAATPLPDALTEVLRELVQLRQRLVQDFGDRVRDLHRLVDLGFPEFTRYVRTLDSELARAILRDYPTAAASRGVSVRRLAALRYDGKHHVGLDLARTLIEAARRSVGQHHSATYRLQIRYACDDLDTLRHCLRDLDRDLDGKLREHEVGRRLTTIDGIGSQTAAGVIAAVGDPAHFRSGSALAAYVGAIPALAQSGKRQTMRGAITPIGNAPLRAALWMPTLCAVRLAAHALPAPARPRQTAQRRLGRLHAQTAARHLQRRQASPTLRPAHHQCPGPHMKKPLDGQHGISLHSEGSVKDYGLRVRTPEHACSPKENRPEGAAVVSAAAVTACGARKRVRPSLNLTRREQDSLAPAQPKAKP